MRPTYSGRGFTAVQGIPLKKRNSAIIGLLTIAVLGLATALLLVLHYDYKHHSGVAQLAEELAAQYYEHASVLVSYAYEEKDEIQVGGRIAALFVHGAAVPRAREPTIPTLNRVVCPSTCISTAAMQMA
jgi:hypothetical protein